MLSMIRCHKFRLPHLSVLLLLVFLVQMTSSSPISYAVVNQDRYWSILTAEHQTTPVNTEARGYAGFKFPDDMKWLIYTINAENIGNVTGIYLYQIDKNQTGTIVLDMLKAEKKHPIDDAKILLMES
jgi:hypothetical protein